MGLGGMVLTTTIHGQGGSIAGPAPGGLNCTGPAGQSGGGGTGGKAKFGGRERKKVRGGQSCKRRREE